MVKGKTKADFQESYSLLRTSVLHLTQSAHATLPAPSDISYYRSLDPSFAANLDNVSSEILSLTNNLLDLTRQAYLPKDVKGKQRQLRDEDDVVNSSEFQRKVVDVIDCLLEATHTNLDDWTGQSKRVATASITANPVRPKPDPTGRLPTQLLNARHLEKPQYNFKQRLSNQRDATFTPLLKAKPNAQQPLAFINITATDEHGQQHSFMQNPYKHELELFLQNPPSSLSKDPTSPPQMPADSFETVPYSFVNTSELFDNMLAQLNQADEIAVDIEHHDYRSYHGFVCLIQISILGYDYVIDTLDPQVRERIIDLNQPFTDPAKIKVFHGAARDIEWLQRDFGVYVVGMFDTYQASKILDYPQHSLASLLLRFCAFEADKRYQLADWRIRPLPEEMAFYARADTHFLLYVYHSLLSAMKQQFKMEYSDTIQTVLRASADTCSQSFQYPIYRHETGLGSRGWRTGLQKWGKNTGYGLPQMPLPFSIAPNVSYKSAAPSALEFYVYRALHDWRDKVSRAEDESDRFVLPPAMLFRLAEKRPTTSSALLAILSSVSQPIHNRREELVQLIQQKVEDWQSLPDTKLPTIQVNSESVTAFKDVEMTSPPQSSPSQRPIADLFSVTTPKLLAATSGLLKKPAQAIPAASNGIRKASSSLFGAKTAPISMTLQMSAILSSIHSSLAAIQAPQHALSDSPAVEVEQPDVIQSIASRSSSPVPQDDIVIVSESAKKRKKKRKEPFDSTSSPEKVKRSKATTDLLPAGQNSTEFVDILDQDPTTADSPRKKHKKPKAAQSNPNVPHFKSFPKQVKGTLSQTFT